MIRPLSAPTTKPVDARPDATRTAWFVMALLMLTTALNVADRNLLSILVRPIQAEFGVSDTAMGLLGGFWFAVVHNMAILPVARLADRGSRRSIIAVGLMLWSGFTVVSGFVQSYMQMLLARVGVSAAETAGSAPVHSLIADYFPSHQRATALGMISVGGVTGIGLGLAIGGVIAQEWGWRVAFFAFGAPGLLLALVVRTMVQEPERGAIDGMVVDKDPVPLREVVTYLRSRRAYVHMIIAASFHSFSSMGVSFWYPAYLGRIQGLDLAAAGIT